MNIVIQCIDIATSSTLGSILKRDRYMASNCDWLFNANNQRKMVIYAHNMHIAKATDNSMKKLMGQYISQLHPDFYVIGTGFSKGSVGIKRKNYTPSFYKEAINNSYDYFFAKCQYLSYFLDFDIIDDAGLKSFLGSKNLSRNTGGNQYEDNVVNEKQNYRKHVLDKSYDALLFFKESSPTQKMSVFD
jgi:erythromycin esterase